MVGARPPAVEREVALEHGGSRRHGGEADIDAQAVVGVPDGQLEVVAQAVIARRLASSAGAG